jgi:hypothetical protein
MLHIYPYIYSGVVATVEAELVEGHSRHLLSITC